MGILSTIGRLLGSGSSSRLAGGTALWGPDWIASAGGDPLSNPAPADAARHTPIYSAITLLSSSLASINPMLAATSATGGRMPVSGTAAGEALARWPLHEREAIFADALLGGNGFAQIIRDGRGAPYSLRWLPAWRVAVEVADSGEHRYHVDADEAVAEPAQILPAGDVLHIRYRMVGTTNRLMGQSPLAQCAPSMALVLAVRTQSTRLYRNLSLPLSVLRHPKTLSQEAVQRLKVSYEAAVGGEKNGSPVVLMENMEVKQLDVGKATDMQIAELMQVTVREAARVYGLPASLLSEADTSYATAAESARQFVLHSLRPWSARIGDAINRAMLTEAQRHNGIGVHFDLTGLVLGFGGEQADYLGKLVSCGVMTSNEARALIGLIDRPDGTELRHPVNTMPVGGNDDDDDDEPDAKAKGLIAWLHRHDAE